MIRFLCALVVLTAPLGLAQNDSIGVVISPQSIVVNPRPSFEVDVFLDKEAGDTPSYSIGEDIRIGVRVSEDAYVYLFNVRASGEIVQIMPNRLDAGSGNRLRAGQTQYFPPENARYTFEVQGPTGLDKVIAVASKEQLDVSTLAQFTSESDFATSSQGEQSFAETLSIIVRPLPQETWVTDTALFYTVQSGQPAPQERFGTLEISSSPSGATVYVDGQFVGYTPVRYGTSAGNHTVRVELSGQRSFQTQVSVSGGQTASVHADLGSATRQGSILIQANVGGAEVHLDGRFVGIIASGSGRLQVDGVSPGDHTVRLVASGFDTVEQTISVQAGRTSTVSLRQSRTQQAPPRGGPLMDRLGLSQYPNSAIRRLEQDDEKLTLEFETGDGFGDVLDFFHNHLVDSGWQRRDFDLRRAPTKAEARYVSNGQDLEFTLDRQGNSGRYKLELKLDD